MPGSSWRGVSVLILSGFLLSSCASSGVFRNDPFTPSASPAQTLFAPARPADAAVQTKPDISKPDSSRPLAKNDSRRVAAERAAAQAALRSAGLEIPASSEATASASPAIAYAGAANPSFGFWARFEANSDADTALWARSVSNAASNGASNVGFDNATWTPALKTADTQALAPDSQPLASDSQALASDSRAPAPAWGSRLSGVELLIANEVARRLGPQWMPVALRIARTESGFDCGARNGHALGVFQVISPSEFGVSSSAALTCAGGVMAGIAHMERCLRKGVTDAKHMYICHNTGSPLGTRLSPAYRHLVRHAGDLALVASP